MFDSFTLPEGKTRPQKEENFTVIRLFHINDFSHPITTPHRSPVVTCGDVFTRTYNYT